MSQKGLVFTSAQAVEEPLIMGNWEIDSYMEVEKNKGDIDLDVENIDNTTDNP